MNRLQRGLYAMLLLGCSAALYASSKPNGFAVASAHPLATQAGLDILQQGGNAFDAAVAVSAALAVVEPSGSGLGGGGFWLLHISSENRNVFVDGREVAPQAAHANMYLNAQGMVLPGASRDGALAAAIPGEPAALAHIATKYGQLELKQSLAPAIKLAREGVRVDTRLVQLMGFRIGQLRNNPGAASIFLDQGELPEIGSQLLQPDLARTLEAIAERGFDGFYMGSIANQLVNAVRASGGIWSLQDLADYQIQERVPIEVEFEGFKLVSAPPPSSGGIALTTILNILSAYELPSLSETAQIHLLVEAMRRAYRDRAYYLGDPDFVSIPQARLSHPWYAEGLRASIRLDKATPSAMLPGDGPGEKGEDTTHFSVLDSRGNRVAATLSINLPFGSGFVAPGTGVLLNNEMDDFSIKPGEPNAYGLVGAEANAIAPGKRPLSSMTPTFVETPDRIAILGTPGGSRIITMVLLGILEFLKGELPEQWVDKARFHHQYLPDKLYHEQRAFSDPVAKALTGLGHQLEPSLREYGNMQAILWQIPENQIHAASDGRGLGSAKVIPLSQARVAN
jgi:gamma-glutamyltranspeptidase / glutathione hydrolase